MNLKLSELARKRWADPIKREKLMLSLKNKCGTPEERFWSKVQKRTGIFIFIANQQSECWRWTAGLSRDGYGTFHFSGTDTLAHRAVYQMQIGSIPKGRTVDHLCFNRWCVNPAHLEAVPHAENVMRSALRRRKAIVRNVVIQQETEEVSDLEVQPWLPTQYKDIPGSPGYRAGSDGTIWSIRSTASSGRGVLCDWKRLSLSSGSTRGGHLVVNISGVPRLVHRLVLLTFVGPPLPKQVCRHLDGDPTNNQLSNLCWGTMKENQADRNRHGTSNRGERNGMSKLLPQDVFAIRELYETTKLSQREIGARFGVSAATVIHILKGECWGHLRFHNAA